MAKAMTGTWKCTGKADTEDGMEDVRVTATFKTELDGFWMRSTVTVTAAKLTMHTEAMTTYDVVAKKFFRQTSNSHGGHGTAWGTASGAKTSWEGDGHSSRTGKDLKLRNTEERVSPREVHLVGEWSGDGGKTWNPGQDVTCTK